MPPLSHIRVPLSSLLSTPPYPFSYIFSPSTSSSFPTIPRIHTSQHHHSFLSPYPHIPCYHYQQLYLYFYPLTYLTLRYISPLIPITLVIPLPPYLHRTSTPPPPNPPPPRLRFCYGGAVKRGKYHFAKKRAKLPLKSILFKKVYDYIDGAIKIVFMRYFVANRSIHNLRDNRFSGKAGKMHKLYRLQFKAAFYRLQVFYCQYVIIAK